MAAHRIARDRTAERIIDALRLCQLPARETPNASWIEDDSGGLPRHDPTAWNQGHACTL